MEEYRITDIITCCLANDWAVIRSKVYKELCKEIEVNLRAKINWGLQNDFKVDCLTIKHSVFNKMYFVINSTPEFFDTER